MRNFYFLFLCFCLLAVAGCNKDPLYTPASTNSTQMLGFGLERTQSNPNLNRYYDGMIVGDTAVRLTVDYGTDITSLEPTLIAYADSVFPKGKQNFTNPVKYTVWAKGKSATYTVSIKVSTIQQPVIQTIVSGSSHVMALKNDGTLWAAGDNSYGQLGLGDYSSHNTMTQVPVYDVAKVYTGDCATVVILKDGTAWATGNQYGQLGLGNTFTVVNFVRQPFLDDASQIAVTFGEIIALKPDGTLWGAGKNNFQVLAQGDKTVKSSFVKIPITDVKQISATTWDVMAQKTNGELWGWGYNFLGELGLGDSTMRGTPVKIPVVANIKKMFCGANNSFLLDDARQVWAVGNNNAGQLGFGDQGKHQSFAVVPFFNGKGISEIQNPSACAMFKDGAGNIWGVGANFSGQFGLGTAVTLPYLTPIQINGSVQALSARLNTAFVLKTDGTLWGCGANPSGVLNINSTSTYSPIQLLK
jgi:alpha-tubulin suppressor-like RCC1 family protein